MQKLWAVVHSRIQPRSGAGQLVYTWFLGLPVCLLILNVVTPHSRKVKFSLSPMSGLASLPSPLTQWGPPPTPTVPKGKSAPSPRCSAPLPCLGKGSKLEAARWGGVGARVKTSPPAKSPIGVGCWNLGEKEERKVNQESPPGFLWSRVRQDRCCLLVSS